MRLRIASFGFAAAVFFLDRLTKAVIETRVSLWDSHVVIPGFFNIIHTQNRGAVFGLLAEASGSWRDFLLIGVTALVLVFVAGLLWQVAGGRAPLPLRLGLSLILGGAMGNLYDRVLRGSVTDFLQFFLGRYEWPAFNVADSAITVGAGLLLVDLWRQRRVADRT